MKLTLFFVFLLSISKALLLLFIGLLVKALFESLVPNLLNNYAINCGGDWTSGNLVKWGKWIGVAIILVAVFYGVQSFVQWLVSMQIPNTVREMILNN